MPWQNNEERRQAIKAYCRRVDDASSILRWIMVDLDDDGFDWLAERIEITLVALGIWLAKDFERD